MVHVSGKCHETGKGGTVDLVTVLLGLSVPVREPNRFRRGPFGSTWDQILNVDLSTNEVPPQFVGPILLSPRPPKLVPRSGSTIWSTNVHPWTTLFEVVHRHLNFVISSMAKRVVSQNKGK